MRVTLWYACLLLLICLLLFTVMTIAANGAAREYCRQTLQNALTMVKDELEYEDGRLEIQSGIDEIPNVYATLFRADGSVLYGRQRVRMRLKRASCAAQPTAGIAGISWMSGLNTAKARKSGCAYTPPRTFPGTRSCPCFATVFGFPVVGRVCASRRACADCTAFRPVKEMTALAGSIAGGEDLVPPHRPWRGQG